MHVVEEVVVVVAHRTSLSLSDKRSLEPLQFAAHVIRIQRIVL